MHGLIIAMVPLLIFMIGAGFYSASTRFVAVEKFIDWILDMTKLND